MELLIKRKTENGSNTIKLTELAKQLNIAKIEENTALMIALKTKVNKLPKLSKKAILELISNEVMLYKNPVNFTNAASIEKNEKAQIGTMYFNTRTNKLRLKKKIGWVTVNTD